VTPDEEKKMRTPASEDSNTVSVLEKSIGPPTGSAQTDGALLRSFDAPIGEENASMNKSGQTAIAIARPTLPQLQRLYPVVGTQVNAAMEGVADKARWYAEHSCARSTLRNYGMWWRLVLELCEQWSVGPIPMSVDTAVCIVTEMADRGYGWGSIRNACCAIKMAHRLAKMPDPTKVYAVQSVLRGIATEVSVKPTHRKIAVVGGDMHKIACAAREGPQPRGLLEWAVLATGFYAGLRRSEIVGLNIEDVRVDAMGMTLVIIMSKTDQAGDTEEVRVERVPENPEMCGVAAVEAWLKWLGRSYGPLFRRLGSGNILGGRLASRAVSRMLKRYAVPMGYHATDLGAHSLRAGCVTHLKDKGVDDITIAAHVRHHTLDTTRIYDRPKGPRQNLAELLSS
jgi:site-specific recombinase XerD